MNKAFTEEQLQELALLMFDSGYLTLPEHETLLTEWFKQNPIVPVAVGLSDGQMQDLAHYFSHNMHTHPNDTEQEVENWLKTQTFAQPQQFGPSWDDAPKDAVFWATTPGNGSGCDSWPRSRAAGSYLPHAGEHTRRAHPRRRRDAAQVL